MEKTSQEVSLQRARFEHELAQAELQRVADPRTLALYAVAVSSRPGLLQAVPELQAIEAVLSEIESAHSKVQVMLKAHNVRADKIDEASAA